VCTVWVKWEYVEGWPSRCVYTISIKKLVPSNTTHLSFIGWNGLWKITNVVPSAVPLVGGLQVCSVKFTVKVLFFLLQKLNLIFNMLKLYFLFCVAGCGGSLGDFYLALAFINHFNQWKINVLCMTVLTLWRRSFS
jgi:hypothetical protein